MPRVASLNDPAPRLSADNTKQGLLATSSDVRTDTAQSDRGSDVRVVVAFVEAEVDRPSWATRAADRYGIEHLADHGGVWHIRAADQRCDRHAAAVGRYMAFYAAFRPVRRVRPREVPPFGAFTEALSRELHFQEIPRRSS